MEGGPAEIAEVLSSCIQDLMDCTPFGEAPGSACEIGDSICLEDSLTDLDGLLDSACPDSDAAALIELEEFHGVCQH